jgi:hypothetical protein
MTATLRWGRLWNARWTPGGGYAVLYPLLLVAAATAYWRTDGCTWSGGGAQSRLFFALLASHEGGTLPDGLPLPTGLSQEDLTETGLNRLQARVQYWIFWKTAWARASYTIAAASLGLFLFRRDLFSAGTFLICFLLAHHSYDLTLIRF